MSGRVALIHARIESAFEAWGRVVARWRWPVLLAMLGLTAGLASWLPRMQTDNSTESFLNEGDPARVVYDRFREEFGQDERMVVAVRPPDVFALPFLEKLRALHADLEAEVPYVTEVTSLVNARNTRGEGDELIVEDLMEDWPESAADVEALRARVLENPLYVNTLVNESATVTTITIEPFIYSTRGREADALAGFDDPASPGDGSPAEAPAFLTGEEGEEQIDAIREVLARYRAPDLELHLAGGNVLSRRSTQMLMRDVRVFMTGGLAVTALLLWVLFRRLSGVALPIVVVLSALVATFGIMVILGIPASVSGQIVPALLLTVGICGAVHILAIVYQRLAVGDARGQAIAYALGHSGLAVSMASATTAAGLFSFSTAPLAQVANLGRVGSIGVLMTFVYCMTMLPALLAILPLRGRVSRSGEWVQAKLSVALARLGDFATSRPWHVLAATVAILLVAVGGVVQLRMSQYGLRWFPESDPARRSVEFIDRELHGAGATEVVVDTGRENGLHDPDVLGRMERAMRFAESIDDGEIYVGKAVSLVDVVKETHKALNENRQEFYRVPGDRELVAQELLLFENSGSDDLEEFTDSLFRKGRIVLRMPFADAMLYPGFLERIRAGFAEILGPDVEITITGLGSLFARTFNVMLPTMARSYVIAFGIITPLMVLLIGNLRRGLIAMVPNLIPVYLTLALMGWLDIVLDNSTLLVGCIIIGLAVDDTIHFMHKFGRYYTQTGDPRAAVRLTLATTGTALLFTSLALAGGFAVMTLAYMRNAAEFGLLATFATAVAFLGDVILAPALMVLFAGRAEPAAEDDRVAPSPRTA